MNDLAPIRARFERFEPNVRLGHIASDLHRLARWVAAGRDAADLQALMRETAWKMEWVGEAATAELADMQRELCRWMRVRPTADVRPVLQLRAERMSARLLEQSGLAGPGEPGTLPAAGT